MKNLFITTILIFGIGIISNAQVNGKFKDEIKVIFENDQMKVTEYASSPGKDACGLGEHSHRAHLTVILTDMKAKVTTRDGKTMEAELPAGTSFWSEAETHSVINTGDKPAKILLIEPKK
jgi:quercetin dioxygenase-like cupin family protein